MSTTRRFLPLAAMALLAVACTSTGAPAGSLSANPSGSPAGSPGASPSPATGVLEHPTGKDDIILRYDEGGGFVIPSFLASRTPYFTLYGDGTVVFQPFKDEPPPTRAEERRAGKESRSRWPPY